jgi:hypothetical protein
MFARSVAGTPREQRRVEVIGRLTPDRAAGERRAGPLESISRQPLDQRKQLAFLTPHVRLEQLADLAHRSTDLGRGPKLCDERVQALVLEEDLHDERTRRVRVGNERKQRLLLFAEMRHADSREELDEFRSYRPGIIVTVGGASETPPLDERVVVVMRQRDESGVALHRCDRSCAPLLSIAEHGGIVGADPLPERCRARQPRVGNERTLVELAGVEADRADE